MREIFDDAEVVRDEKVGKPALLLKPQKEIENLRLHGDVERRRGFVEQNDFGLGGKRPGDRDSLTLPARKFMRIARSASGREPRFVKKPPDAGASLFSIELRALRR